MNSAITSLRLPSARELPALTNVQKTSESQTFEIPYLKPDTVEIELGRIPAAIRTQTEMANLGKRFRNGNTEAWPGAGQPVTRPMPLANQDGTVKVVEAKKTLKIKPQVKNANAVAWGAAGGVLGGIAGFALGTFVGLPFVGAALGVAAVGGTGGAIGATRASNQRVRLGWKKMPVESYRLDGFTHSSTAVYSGSDEHRRFEGFDNRFTPVLSTKLHGHYYEPVVVEYHKDDPTRGEDQLRTTFEFRR